jgi:hypothetical protein
MWAWLDRLTPFLLDAALDAAILSSFAIAILIFCRQPARRITIARTSLLAVLALPILIAILPWPRLELRHSLHRLGLPGFVLGLPPHPRESSLPRQLPTRERTQPGSIDARAEPQTRAVEDHSQPQAQQANLAAVAVPGSVPGALAQVAESAEPGDGTLTSNLLTSPSHPLYRILRRTATLMYLAGIGIGLAWVALGYWGVYLLLGRAFEPSPAAQSLYDSILLEEAIAPAKRPGLLVSTRVSRPVLVAIRRMTILIPPSLDQDDPEQPDRSPLRLSLLHELAHAGQSDPLFTLVGNLAQGFWYGLPQVWWIQAKLRVDQEFLADQGAARSYGTAPAYAQSLLELASGRVAPPAPAASAGPEKSPERLNPAGLDLGESPSTLAQRLLMLLRCPYPLEWQAPRRFVRLTRLAGAIAAIAVASIYVRVPVSGDAIPAVTLPSTNPAPRSFRISHLIVAPIVNTIPGRSLPYIVPAPLAEQFEVNVDLWSSRSLLSQTRIMGHPLAPPVPSPPFLPGTPTGDPASLTSDIESWHTVRFRRDAQGSHLWVDSVPLPTVDEPDSDRLTIEPPAEHQVELRNLIVTW